MKAWEPEEDQIILTMVGTEGPKWKSIVKQLPGRTVSSVRNRWQRIEKGRKLREDGTELKNRCHACGKPKRGHICEAKMRGATLVDIPTPPPHGGLALGLGSQPSLQMPDAPPLFAQGPSPGAGSSAGPSHPALKRTRSGSRLVPVDGAPASLGGGYVSHGLEVDVLKATGGGGQGQGQGLPPLQRVRRHTPPHAATRRHTRCSALGGAMGMRGLLPTYTHTHKHTYTHTHTHRSPPHTLPAPGSATHHSRSPSTPSDEHVFLQGPGARGALLALKPRHV